MPTNDPRAAEYVSRIWRVWNTLNEEKDWTLQMVESTDEYKDLPLFKKQIVVELQNRFPEFETETGRRFMPEMLWTILRFTWGEPELAVPSGWDVSDQGSGR